MSVATIVAATLLAGCVTAYFARPTARAFKRSMEYIVDSVIDLLGLSPLWHWRHNDSTAFNRALDSFAHFQTLSLRDVQLKQRSYNRLGQAKRNLAERAMGYQLKLDRYRDIVEQDSKIADGITKCALYDFGVDNVSALGLSQVAPKADASLHWARDALKHVLKDWSSEGDEQRKICFDPIFAALGELEPDARICVPGCGLGRLAYELACKGYDVTACEMSFYMTLPLRWLLSPAVDQIDQHEFHFGSHWWSHQRSTESLFRSTRFPDLVPHPRNNFRLLEGSFLSSALFPSTVSESYNAIVTLYFIDTAIDIIEYITQCYQLLRPGGLLVNFGPILWPSKARLELSLDELIRLIEAIGFEIVEPPRHVDSEYQRDPQGMITWTYHAAFFVVRKPHNA
ncbi:uncharacterized protein L969DRAFT_63306 [Mixia osmundae IAM 14324]|uniref:Uncharacterized protein n=1 Tax=Mixia osmundae (strain CBS 9802 / IAM 14324 / JCM 22182 / KY 12970) TaxID=764103 RepID=G7E745_MIXOS|nr:uncharacterized protein L969DRAFT_63306 [Mixia osmundae IAM 14324]KEI38958.1 hypothetical protein L969DRAFT_63306 [Mixia osmundae IAM 14324]GAA98655.1 hypothetical protein E5Q_05343 [Mixia osmundae IAM 14324]